MANKEERILCSCYTGEQAKLLAENNLGMTPQEAIEVIAKAICRQDNLLESCRQCLTQCDKEKQKNMCEYILKERKDNIEPSYFDKAEVALNALLKGVNK